MSVKKRPHYSLGEYFSIEQMSGIKHEYLDGDIFAMVGGTLNHNQIKDNISELLRRELRDRGCRVLTSDMRVRTGTRLYTYPDLVALCDRPDIETGPDGIQTLLNPLLIVEVLSKSTEGYDKEDKFEHYKTIASFQEYLLVDQYKPEIISHYRQTNDQWLVSTTTDLNGTVQLSSLQVALSVNAIYHLVDF